PGKLGMETGADFEEAANASVEFDLASGRFGDLRQDLEQCAFTGAVATNNADNFAFLNVEGDIVQGPKGLVRLAAAGQAPEPLKGRPECSAQGLAEVGVATLARTELVLLAQIA